METKIKNGTGRRTGQIILGVAGGILVADAIKVGITWVAAKVAARKIKREFDTL